MKDNIKFFKNSKILSIDNFFSNVLYDQNNGYYNNYQPFGQKGDFVTAPKISKLFSEMIAIWMVSTWEILGRPKKINIIELGPGDGTLMKDLLKTFKSFPKFNSAKSVYLYEKSKFLKKFQKKIIKSKKIKWIDNLRDIKDGPVIFFGNEFFDAIPIKQFKMKKNCLFEKYYSLKKDNQILEVFKKAKKKDVNEIKSYTVLKNLRFIEFPKNGLTELKRIINKISKLKGCILIIDYGYLKAPNQSTLQSVMRHQKNNILDNLGRADITAHVNFSLLKEFFKKNNLKVKKTITQEKFLKKMGIIERAEIISKNMKFSEKTNLYFRLKRLLSKKSMGGLFNAILAYNSKSNNYFGFD